MRDMENSSSKATAYATRSDVCRIFQQEMKSLYLLSLLLTGGQDSAEQCFTASLGDCMDLSSVVKEWTHLWTRSILLRNAIRMLRPAANNVDEAQQSRLSSHGSELHSTLRAVLRLNTFERFVFVMSVLEGCSDHECSLLLRCSKRDVVVAKAKALGHLATISRVEESLRTGARAEAQFAGMENGQRTA